MKRAAPFLWAPLFRLRFGFSALSSSGFRIRACDADADNKLAFNPLAKTYASPDRASLQPPLLPSQDAALQTTSR
jgi:hypothetical protein